MRRPDPIILVLIFTLLVFGLLMLSSASSVVANEKFQDSFYFIKRQMFVGVLPGLILFLFFSRLPYRLWRKVILPVFIASLLLLVMVFVPGLGQNYNRAQSWINLGGISFQPSEIVKVLFLVYLAAWLAARREDGHRDFISHFLPFLILLGFLAGLLIAQPDVGTMMIIVATAVALYFIAGGRWLYLLSLGGAGTALLYFLIQKAPYRLDRLMVFLNPEMDPQGVGYQMNQALLAIGSGGIFGKGFGLSRQKFLYLPEVASDSIFAIISEELGFVVAAALVALFVAFALRGLYLSKRAPDLFGKYLAIGLTCLIIIQAFVNIGAIVGLMPLTGLPLPFISYGGTAMAMTLGAMGILVNVSRFTKT